MHKDVPKDRKQEEVSSDTTSKTDEIIARRETALVEEEVTLLEWQALSRVYKERNKEFYTTIGAGVLLICILLLFVREFFLMIVVLALAFVAYMFASVKPDKIPYKISSRGIWVDDKFYGWELLTGFCIEEKVGYQVLYVPTTMAFPTQLMVLLGDQDQEKIKDILADYLIYHKPDPGFVDKAGAWLSEKVPLE